MKIPNKNKWLVCLVIPKHKLDVSEKLDKIDEHRMKLGIGDLTTSPSQ